MNDKYQVGQFGRFKFTIKKKRNGTLIITPFDIEGAMITDIDPSHIYLLSTDGQPFLVERKRIKDFEPMTVPKDLYKIII